jgi:alpha,alpha-trehalase
VCLAHYGGNGIGQPPEVEPGHFDWLYQKIGGETGLPWEQLKERYKSGRLRNARLDSFFRHDRCMRESGHDTTYRFHDDELGTGRCADFATVDLNSLLYKFETDLAKLLGIVESQGASVRGDVAQAPGSETASFSAFGTVLGPAAFCERAKARAALIRRYMWNEEANLFFDYDTAKSTPSDYLSATTLYPLWASSDACGAPLLDKNEAESLVTRALSELEESGGIAATARSSAQRYQKLKARQWEFPNGWAPHQVLAWQGLARFGFVETQRRLTEKWLTMIVDNAAKFAGTIPEKFDVVARSHRVFAEYGNVGTEFSYITDVGFGWMYASFQLGRALLDPERRRELDGRGAPTLPVGSMAWPASDQPAPTLPRTR